MIRKVAFQCPRGSVIDEPIPDKNRINDKEEEDDDDGGHDDNPHLFFEKAMVFSSIIPFKKC